MSLTSTVIYGKILQVIYRNLAKRSDMKMNRKATISSKTLSLITVMIFLCVITIMLAGGRYMNSCIKAADNARQNSEALRELGEKLADASDYLTDEARRYSVTGDITHLYNYWHEVYS